MRVPVLVFGIAWILILSGSIGVVGAVSGDGMLQGQSANEQIEQTITINVSENGNADVRISQRLPAETDAQQAAFDQLANEFERGEHDIGGTAIIRIVEEVDQDLDRTMDVRNEQRVTNRSNGVGTLTHTFVWTNFANVSEDRITIGDAFRVDGTNWLGSLEAGQQLTITVPDGYAITSSPQGHEDNRITWMGPETFTAGDIEITLERTAFGPFLEESTAIMVALLVGAIVITGLWTYRRRQRSTTPAETTTTPQPSTSTETTADEPPAENEAPVDPELLSDEERVTRLLEKNDGRMKQAMIVEETGWSSAKVSQLLSKMEEDGQINKLRIGRENLISLPEENVTEFD